MGMNDEQKQLALNFLLNDVIQKAQDTANSEVDKLKNELISDMKKIRNNLEIIKNEVSETLANTGTVVNLGTVEEPKKEKAHKSFKTISKILSSAKRKEKNIMLVGGAGGGKTHLVKQLAEALKLPFYPMSVGMQTTKSDLLGFINAHGQYMPSIVREAYENGGVLLLDEFDSAHAGVVTILNSLLANGHASFPDKVISKHQNFVCLVACNTFGDGASLEYIGRNRLDGATLDRFVVVEVDYDTKLEKSLTNNDLWYDIIKKIRKNAEQCGIKVIISPRASMDGADLLDAGFTVKEVLKMTVFKGCNEEIVKKLSQGIDFGNTKQNEEKGINIEELCNKYDFVGVIKNNSFKIEKGVGYLFESSTLSISPEVARTGLRCVGRDIEDFAVDSMSEETIVGMRNVEAESEGLVIQRHKDKIMNNIKNGIEIAENNGEKIAFVIEFDGEQPVCLSSVK